MELSAENTVEKYFDDVESVLTCRWISPPAWWKGDDELNLLHELSWSITRLCRETYGPPNKRGKLKRLDGISYGIGGDYDVLLCPGSKFADRFINMICENKTLQEFTSSASTVIISKEEMDRLQYSLIPMPGTLKVSSNCNVRVHLRQTENKECVRCGGFYIEPKIDEFDFATSSSCVDCNQMESELMEH